MPQNLKVMAITYLKLEEIKSKLDLQFKKSEDFLGSLYLAKASLGQINYQIRIRETSPEPSTEILLSTETAISDLDEILRALHLSRENLFWIHPRAGGTLRRHTVDALFANLEIDRPLMQILVGPRQVGKTTSVKHLIKEWSGPTWYASADSIIDDYGPWLEIQWQEALSKGEGTLLVLDEIQKVDNWQELVKKLWDKTQKRGLRVVLLGSTSLTHYLPHKVQESLSGRFNSHYVPHWSYLETKEGFGTSPTDYSLFGGYPKAMEFSSDHTRWLEYMGSSIINPIIDVDIYQQGNFKKIENLKRAFKVFCNDLDEEVNYSHLLREIQQTGNTDIIRRYLDGYYDSFLLSPVNSIDDNGIPDSRVNPQLMVNCPAVYTFGKTSFTNVSEDPIRFKQSIASELKKIPNNTFGHWKKNDKVGVDFFIRTTDNNTFGIIIDKQNKSNFSPESSDVFRKTFKNSKIAYVTPDNYKSLLEGQRAFLEDVAT